MKRKALLALVFVAGCAGGNRSPVAPPEGIAPPSNPEVIEDDSAEPDTVEVAENEVAEEVSKPVEVVTTLSLCEPIGERWKHGDRKQRNEARALIDKTCEAMGVGEEDCKYFRDIISVRESHYRWWVRHKLAGDVSAALSSYMGRSNRYGWTASWSDEAKRAEDISKIDLEPYGDEQNLYFQDPTRWMFGLGLGGLNIVYHLRKFDHMAPPEILCDPVINTMIQITIARNAVWKYKAENFPEIQAVYGGRTYHNKNGKVRPLSCTRGCDKILSENQIARAKDGDRKILNRCTKKELDCYKTPELGEEYILQEMSREERYKAADEIRGKALPPFDTPPKRRSTAGAKED